MILLDTGSSGRVWAVAFHPDGKHVLGGNDDGIRRWRLADGQEVAKQTGMKLQAICVSRDDKWIVCGTDGAGANVWDGEIHKKLIHVEGKTVVDAVDVSPDSTRFATGTRNGEASIWNILTGWRLAGPLKLDNFVSGVRFSPSGEHIAAACYTGIQIFDSQTGDKLVTINTDQPGWGATTPLAWSSKGQNIFAASREEKIRVFDPSTATQLAQSQILSGGDNDVPSIALGANGKFIATLQVKDQCISFLDTSTLALIGPVIQDSEGIRSVAISLDSTRLATGRHDGKIAIRDLRRILPELCGPVSVSICTLLCSIPHVDKMHGYLLANRLNKTRSC